MPAQREGIAGDRLCVVVLDGYANVEFAPLGERALIIGRDPDCAIRVAAYAVSRRHCAIWRDGDGIWLLDLASRNGTFVDGRGLIFGAVAPGAIIRLGKPAQVSLTIRCSVA